VNVVLVFLGALLLAMVSWRLLRPMLAAPVFQRENFRGAALPVGAGLGVVLAVLVGAVLLSPAVLWSGDGPLLRRSITSAVVVSVGFGLFGLLDDLVGTGARRGFGGHLGALRHGELTTGLLKLIGGGLVALVAAWPWVGGSLPRLVGAGLVIALAANLGNLLDRAPGRVGKVSLLVFVVLAAVSRLDVDLTGPALIAGAGAGMLAPDLKERCMLGDTGANVLGAGGGLALVAVTGPGAWWVAVVVLAALNIVSERISFSRVIARTPPLHWFDRLGARPR
jgi:UDP-N-acetylmuramyl pentapeptide phosphotransferase/UDP-N-acetylglucosamine-1-phosphate transferase